MRRTSFTLLAFIGAFILTHVLWFIMSILQYIPIFGSIYALVIWVADLWYGWLGHWIGLSAVNLIAFLVALNSASEVFSNFKGTKSVEIPVANDGARLANSQSTSVQTLAGRNSRLRTIWTVTRYILFIPAMLLAAGILMVIFLLFGLPFLKPDSTYYEGFISLLPINIAFDVLSPLVVITLACFVCPSRHWAAPLNNRRSLYICRRKHAHIHIGG